MVDSSCLEAGEVIPEDGAHLHLGDGATSTTLDLPAGEHTLCLQAGDGRHRALDITDEVTITVEAPTPAGEGEAEEEQPSGLESWEGTYAGTATHDCGPAGLQPSTLEGTFTISVDEQGTATLEGSNTVVGSCAGPDKGRLTTPISMTGERTATGFEFPAALWQVPGTFTITAADGRGEGTLEGDAPGPTHVLIDFDVQCTSC
jgi:hypothetical protein